MWSMSSTHTHAPTDTHAHAHRHTHTHTHTHTYTQKEAHIKPAFIVDICAIKTQVYWQVSNIPEFIPLGP